MGTERLNAPPRPPLLRGTDSILFSMLTQYRRTSTVLRSSTEYSVHSIHNA